MEEVKKVLIIGSGCAGLTAAIYAARSNLEPLVINGLQPGGQLTTTTEVENFPGFPNGIDGFELTNNMRLQAERFGAQFLDDDIIDVDFSGDIKIAIGKNETYRSHVVIIATGASPKLLGVEGEQTFFGGGGVSVCATCDGAFYKKKEVVVVGGGDTACEEASFLTNFCSKVYLIHWRDSLRASPPMQQRVLNQPKIVPIWNSKVEKILGTTKVEKIVISNVLDQSLQEIQCAGVFLAIGLKPNSYPFRRYLELDERGYIKTKKDSFVETNINGVFVAGDCVDKIYRQAVTSAGAGCMAAILAERYINEQAGRN